MESASSSDLFDSNTTGAPAGVPAGAVYVLAVDVEGLRDEGLSLRLSEIGRAESRLAAMKAQVLAEVGRRHSNAVAQRLARDELRSSKREAKRDVESAVQLAQLPATSEALESGEIPQGHARLIARASGESDIDEALLVKAANEQPFEEFVQTVRRHQQDCSDDDGQTILDRQRKRRSARIFESPETGMFVLSGQFDQITGTRIATALTAKERELWHREDPNARRTPQQRMADALAELVCEPGDGKTQGTNLLVIADYDVIKKELINARLADGSPIPIGELRLLARDADILPSIFDAKTQNMWLGRQRRTASEAQRVALMARDEGCVCCKANPLWCKAHHIIWWSKNGPTDLDNLLLVCDDCHKKIHLHGWTVHQHPKTRKYYLKPPNPNGSNRAQQEPNQLARSGKLNRIASQPTQPARSGRVNGVATAAQHNPRDRRDQGKVNSGATQPTRSTRSREGQQRRNPTHEIDEIKGRSTAAQPNPRDRRDQGKVNSGATQPTRSTRSREGQQRRNPTHEIDEIKGRSTAAQPNPRDRRDQGKVNSGATQPTGSTRSREGQQRRNTTQPARSEKVNRDTPGAQPNRGGRKGSEVDYFGGDQVGVGFGK